MERSVQISATADRAAERGSAARETLWTVQAMRAAAALMVVVGHSQTAIATMRDHADMPFGRWTLLPWGAGVDLFFVISGFIMVYASRRLFAAPEAATTFLRRRIIRIAPLYWAATLAYLALLGAASLKGGDPFPSMAAILSSFLFLPWNAGGGVFPVFDLGWTLNYEMFFYLLFAIVLGLPRRVAVLVLEGILALLVIIGLTGIGAHSAQLFFWTRAIMFDFGLGALIGLAHAERVRLPGLLRVALAAAGTLILILDPAHLFNGSLGETVSNGWPRVIAAGIPATMILAGSVLGASPAGGWIAMPATRLGDASYSLYLLHPFVLIVTEKLMQKVPVVRTLPAIVLVPIIVAASIVVALVAFRVFERPVTNYLRHGGARRGPMVRFRDWVAP